MKRREFIGQTAAMAASAVMSRCGAEAADIKDLNRPNILWLVSEDNTTLLGCFGDKLAKTPTIDRLAREGVLFESCFAQPVCAPSRFALITGTFAASSGPAHHMRAKGRIPPWLKGFPEFLRKAGYFCTNNAKTDYNSPIDLKDTWDACGNNAHYRNRPDKSQPFFSVFNHEATHESCLFPEGANETDPSKVRLPPYQPDTPEIREDWARYYDRIAQMDAQIGEKLKELEKAGLAEDTIVFYYSDNGGVLPRSKRFLQASGTHVPLIVYFPPKWRHLSPAAPGSRLRQPVSFVDFAPTVLELTGVKAPGYMQGRPFCGAKPGRNEYVFCTRDRMDERWDMMRSATDGRWLYIRNFRPDLPYVQPMQYMFRARGYQSLAKLAAEGNLSRATGMFWGTKPAEELYDLGSDPDNVSNLADDIKHAGTLDRLRKALRDHTLEIMDNGFLPEGSALEGYEQSRKPDAYPIGRVYDVACRASAGSMADLPKLMEALDDTSEPVRWWAAQGLTVLGDKAAEAAERLRAKLSDSSPAVAVAAAEALVGMGRTKEALPALERRLQDAENKEAALMAAAVLDRMGEAAKPALGVMRRVLRRVRQFDFSAGMDGYIRRVLEHAIQEQAS